MGKAQNHSKSQNFCRKGEIGVFPSPRAYIEGGGGGYSSKVSRKMKKYGGNIFTSFGYKTPGLTNVKRSAGARNFINSAAIEKGDSILDVRKVVMLNKV